MNQKRLRITIDITPRQHRFLIKLSHGWRKQIFGALIDLLIDQVRINGMESLSKLMVRGLSTDDFFLEEDSDEY